MRRRDFLELCAVSCAAASTASRAFAASAQPKRYARAKLVDVGGRPIKANALPVERAFIFHYPFAATPCFLLNLADSTKPQAQLTTADAERYEWGGGVGPRHSIVAYSAICSHRLTYPTKEISFIGFRDTPSTAAPANNATHVIHCCSEHSQYDPAEGARVVGGPAPQPLAAISLEYDRASDELAAVGTVGGEMFNEFFARYEFKLALEHGSGARKPIASVCTVSELTQYCRQTVKC